MNNLTFADIVALGGVAFFAIVILLVGINHLFKDAADADQ